MNTELYHYGIKGQKWGIRRYQRKDGSLTPLGKRRIEEGAIPYYPKYKGKRLKPNDKRLQNREAVLKGRGIEKTYSEREEYDKYSKKHPNWDTDFKNKADQDGTYFDSYEYWRANIQDQKALTAARQNHAKQFLDKYSDAILQDLDIEVTESAKKYAEDAILEKWGNIKIHI